MNTTRATIHMALACYLSDEPGKAIRQLAKRVRRTTKSARTRATMRTIISSHDPATLVWRVYAESFITK